MFLPHLELGLISLAPCLPVGVGGKRTQLDDGLLLTVKLGTCGGRDGLLQTSECIGAASHQVGRQFLKLLGHLVLGLFGDLVEDEPVVGIRLAVFIHLGFVLGNKRVEQRGAHGPFHPKFINLVQGVDRSLVGGVHTHVAVGIGAQGLLYVVDLVLQLYKSCDLGLAGFELLAQRAQKLPELCQIVIEFL